VQVAGIHVRNLEPLLQRPGGECDLAHGLTALGALPGLTLSQKHNGLAQACELEV
jgi:hypothetical protein